MLNLFLKKQTKKKRAKPMVIGHRGSPKHAPENTLLSFLKAVEHGVDMVELDVHMTKDGELIVMHDPTVVRMTRKGGRIRKYIQHLVDKSALIKKLKLEEVKLLQIMGQEVPTLEEALVALKGKCKINIESKVKKAAREIVRLVKKYGLIDEVIISSRIQAFLKRVKELDPEVKTALIFSRPTVNVVKTAKRLELYALHPHMSVAPKRLIDRAHKAGLRVNVWGPTTKGGIKRFINRGADGVITDYPHLMNGE